MIKRLLTLAVICIMGLLAYNSFFGTAEDKANIKKFTSELKDVGKVLGDILKNEKVKFDAGEYNQALQQIGDKFAALGDKVKDMDGDYSQRLTDLQEKKEYLEKMLDNTQNSRLTEDAKKSAEDELKTQLRRFTQDIEKLAEDVEKEGE